MATDGDGGASAVSRKADLALAAGARAGSARTAAAGRFHRARTAQQLMRLTCGWLSVGVAPLGPGRQHVLSVVDRDPSDEIRTSLHGLRQ